jgi:ABC-type phosphate transport system substrate-binding protein
MRPRVGHLAGVVWIITSLVFTANCSRDTLARNYPRVDGSTSTHPLAVLAACKLQGVAYEWKRPPALQRTVFPSRRDHPLRAARIENTIKHHGTHEAYVALIENKTDLILEAREASPRELEAARRAGVGLEVTPIALDALVFVVNVKNPIENLTLDQVRNIFGAAGRQSTALEAFQREPDSGSQELMGTLVMKGLPMRDLPRIYTMAGVVHTVAMHDRGIAFSIYYYVTNMAPNERVKMIAIDGVKPTASSIAARTYPLTNAVFVVLRKGMPHESPAARLREWFQTTEGQAAVRESGYIIGGRS